MRKQKDEDHDIDGPPDRMITRMQQTLEDTADTALKRTAALYETIIGETAEIERIAAKRRLDDDDTTAIYGYGQIMDQVKFLLEQTVSFLQKSSERLDQSKRQIASIEALRVLQEATKSAQGRAQ